jgi:hypothetical protein
VLADGVVVGRIPVREVAVGCPWSARSAPRGHLNERDRPLLGGQYQLHAEVAEVDGHMGTRDLSLSREPLVIYSGPDEKWQSYVVLPFAAGIRGREIKLT